MQLPTVLLVWVAATTAAPWPQDPGTLPLSPPTARPPIIITLPRRILRPTPQPTPEPTPEPTPQPTPQPTPEPTSPPALPLCGNLETAAEMKQLGFSRGTGVFSSSSSSRGSANTKCRSRSDTSENALAAAGNAAVTGAGNSVGGGAFKQGARANTEVKQTPDGVSVNTATGGSGVTAGSSATNQTTDANGGVNVRLLRNALRQGSDGGLVTFSSILRGRGTSSSGHSGSSSGDGELDVSNESGTQIIFSQLTTPRPRGD
nr:CP19k-like protein 5 isoform 2 [Amphibalanus amphitrite]